MAAELGRRLAEVELAGEKSARAMPSPLLTFDAKMRVTE